MLRPFSQRNLFGNLHSKEEENLLDVGQHQHGPRKDPPDEQEDYLHGRQTAMVIQCILDTTITVLINVCRREMMS